MRRFDRPLHVAPACVALLAVALLAGAGMAAKKKTSADAVWTSPNYAKMGVERIALIPVVTYDNNFETANLVESVLGASMKGVQYRWVSATTTREMLRAQSNGTDSLLKVLQAGVLQQGRIDSVQAPHIAKLLNCDGLLTVRVDLWDQQTPEWNQSGKPYTMVQLRSALVDSLGHLAWSAYGGETQEGTYYDPNSGTISVKDNGLDRHPVVAGQSGAPSYREVVSVLLARWATQFPPKAVPAAAAPATAAPDSATAK